MSVTFDTVREIAKALPGVEDGTSYGTPALKYKKKFLARLREDGETVAIRVSLDERDILMQSKPKTFFITDHYLGYPAVLFRLSTATKKDVVNVVNMAYAFVSR